MRDVDEIISLVRAMSPKVKVEQLKVAHPGADDDGLWFFNQPESRFEAQIESSNGMCAFLIEMDETNSRLMGNSVEEVVQILSALLRLPKGDTSGSE